MDELLREFLTETNESLDVVDVELVRFEREPNNVEILSNIFRLVHTIKGTCGFLNLPRLEALTHAAESLMGKFRDGMPVTGEAVSLILSTLDRIKDLLEELERNQGEPSGDDGDLIERLHGMAAGTGPIAAPPASTGQLVYQVLERPLRPGEVSLDELERAFRETPGPDKTPSAAIPAHPPREQPVAPPAASAADEKPEMDEDTRGRMVKPSIRVHVDTLESLMTMVSELVLTRNQLLEIARRHEESEFKAPLQQLSHVTAELQEGIMKTRMQPIGNAWQKLPRIVRDVATEVGKSIEIEMIGSETELDRQLLDLIRDPLTHMVRNSADHGLELPAERRAAGKPDKGTIRLSAYHEGGQIVIEIADDGRGLDTAAIKKKAIAAGLATEAEIAKMSDAQIHKFIFAPGFSTASKISNISGRGVGMDVVRANIDQIGGTIDLKSFPGRGTRIIIKIPLTLAIINVLIVEAAGDRFAIPQLTVVELVRVRANSEHRIERIRNAAVLRLRDKLLPLVDLKSLLKIDDGDGVTIEEGFIVVMQVGSDTFGLIVDNVFDTEEIVVKPLSTKLRHIPLFSGNTILGDGSVIMIVDPNGVGQTLGAAGGARAAFDVSSMAPAVEQKTESMLVFRAGSQRPKAVPISLVTRLEEIDVRTIEWSSERHFVQYRGQLMPLIPANDSVRLREAGTQPILVFADEGRSMGLIVDEIVDIVEDRIVIEAAGSRSGVIGSAVIKGQATEILDIGHFLPLAFEDWCHWNGNGASGARRRILLIDDAPFFRNILAPVLGAAGYDVTTAASGEEGLRILHANPAFDAIVTDIEMPGIDGFALAQALRDDARLDDIPVIGLSAQVSPEAIERGRAVGLHDFVAKFDRRGLIAALKEQTGDMIRAA